MTRFSPGPAASVLLALLVFALPAAGPVGAQPPFASPARYGSPAAPGQPAAQPGQRAAQPGLLVQLGQPAQPGRPGTDKALHAAAGAAAALLAAGVALPWVAERDPGTAAWAAAGVGWAAAAAVGAAKELLDFAGFGDPSGADFQATLAGGLAAGFIVYLLTEGVAARGPQKAGLSIPLISIGLFLALPVAGSWPPAPTGGKRAAGVLP